MVNIHSGVFCTTLLTDMVISFKSDGALTIPVWAIVAICATLPAMMILAAPIGPRAFSTTKEIGTFWSCNACKFLSTVLANKSSFIADAKSSLRRYALTLAGFRAKALTMSGIPIRGIGSGKGAATKIARTSNSFSGIRFSNTTASIGTILAGMTWNILKSYSAYLTNVLDSLNSYCHHASDSVLRGFDSGRTSRIKCLSMVDQTTLAQLESNTILTNCQNVTEV